jgi:hypothetical protein
MSLSTNQNRRIPNKSRRTMVAAMETAIDPRHPRRFEKKKNIDGLRGGAIA